MPDLYGLEVLVRVDVATVGGDDRQQDTEGQEQPVQVPRPPPELHLGEGGETREQGQDRVGVVSRP